MFKMSRKQYADMYGPTTGDRIRLGDTSLIAEVEKDYCIYGEEAKFGGGKSLRDGMGQSCSEPDSSCPDTVITSAVVIDSTGIYKADIGIGVTGTMGNVDPVNGDSIPGQVHFAIAYGPAGDAATVSAFCFDIDVQPTRLAYKLAVADLVVDELFALLG